MSEPITFTLPLRTVSLTNQRCHWSVKAKRARDERHTTWGGFIEAGGRPLDDGEIAGVHMKRVAPRKLDDDNLRGALKSIRDQIAHDLGLDDRDPRIVWMYEQGHGKPGEYAVEVWVAYSTAAGTMLEGCAGRTEGGA
jgi:hypothetical protein